MQPLDEVFRISFADFFHCGGDFDFGPVAQFNQREANLGGDQAKKAQGVFQWDRIALPEQNRGQLSYWGRQPLCSGYLSLPASQIHASAQSGHKIGGDRNAAVAALGKKRQRSRVVA